MIIFLDACIIIYWVEMSAQPYKKLLNKIHHLRDEYDSISFAASELSLLECLVKPVRENDRTIIEHYQRFFGSYDLSLVSINRTVIEQATLLRAQYNLPAPDALQAASALSITEQVIFLTADKGFKKISALNVLLV